MLDGAMALRRRLLDALYSEAMLLADEARGYFDDGVRDERAMLGPLERVVFSCESLKVTTRLMHVIAWLLTQRAIDSGEIAADAMRDPVRMLGDAMPTDPAVLDGMPVTARTLILASIDLHRRVELIDLAQDAPPAASPARAMLDQLTRRL
ncbi:DUF1465 family protein [Sphingomonas sp. CFBP 13720]|nr:DUF1465 family protein [Sphingomonas sp. CFBP 13720]